jgi:serine/threonine protein kinase
MDIIAKEAKTGEEKEFLLAETGDDIILKESTYKVKRIVRGGMATVVLLRLKKRDALSGLPSRIALKCPAKKSIASNEDSLCFEKELKNWCTLQHKNIAECIGVCFAGTKEGYKYPVAIMEEYQGTLARFLRTKAKISYLNNPQEVSPIFLELLEALNYAYQEQTILHLDIKPSNILFTKTRSSLIGAARWPDKIDKKIHLKFFVSDWGIAHAVLRALKIEDKISRTQIVTTLSQVGTPLYMAPERFVPGYKPIIESDIFSLGLVFYEILSGNHLLEPFHEKYEFFKKGSLKHEEPIEKILTGSFYEKIENESKSKKHTVLMQKCLNIIKNMLHPSPSLRVNSYENIIKEIKNVCGSSKKFFIRKKLPQLNDKTNALQKNKIGIAPNDIRKASQCITEDEINKITDASQKVLESPDEFYRLEVFKEDGTITKNSYIKLIIGLTNTIERHISKYRLIKKYQIRSTADEMPDSTPILELSGQLLNMVNEIGFGSLDMQTIAQSYVIQLLQDGLQKTKKESYFSKELIFSGKNINAGNGSDELENDKFSLEDHEVSEIIWQKCILFYLQKIPRGEFGHIQARKIKYETNDDITGFVLSIWKEKPEGYIPLDYEPSFIEKQHNEEKKSSGVKHIVSATQVLYLKELPIEIYQINCQYNYEYEEDHFFASVNKVKTNHYLRLKRHAAAQYLSVIPPLVSIQELWNTQERTKMTPYWHYWNTKQGPADFLAPDAVEYQFGRPVSLEISDIDWYADIKTNHLDKRQTILERYLSEPEE